MAKENENLLDLVCIIPWQLNFAAAFIILAVCHYLLPLLAPENQIGQALAASAPTLGNVFAFILGLGGIFSLINSFLKKKRRESRRRSSDLKDN